MRIKNLLIFTVKRINLLFGSYLSYAYRNSVSIYMFCRAKKKSTISLLRLLNFSIQTFQLPYGFFSVWLHQPEEEIFHRDAIQFNAVFS